MSDEIQNWFTGEDEGHAVFRSPHQTDDWDPLWIRLTDSPEIGRGTRSHSLSNADLRWLQEVLNTHFGDSA